jgi:hypothetical protein
MHGGCREWFPAPTYWLTPPASPAPRRRRRGRRRISQQAVPQSGLRTPPRTAGSQRRQHNSRQKAIKPFRTTRIRSSVTSMGANQSQRRTRIFAINTPLIAGQNPPVLLIGAGQQPGQPAPLSLNTLGVAIHRQPTPIGGHNQADNANHHRPELDHQADNEEQRDQLHRCSLAPGADTASQISRRAARRAAGHTRRRTARPARRAPSTGTPSPNRARRTRTACTRPPAAIIAHGCVLVSRSESYSPTRLPAAPRSPRHGTGASRPSRWLGAGTGVRNRGAQCGRGGVCMSRA